MPVNAVLSSICIALNAGNALVSPKVTEMNEDAVITCEDIPNDPCDGSFAA